jgi:hypothetical protein
MLSSEPQHETRIVRCVLLVACAEAPPAKLRSADCRGYLLGNSAVTFGGHMNSIGSPQAASQR